MINMNDMELLPKLQDRYMRMLDIRATYDKAYEEYSKQAEGLNTWRERDDCYTIVMNKYGLKKNIHVPSKTEISTLGVMIRKIMLDQERNINN